VDCHVMHCGPIRSYHSPVTSLLITYHLPIVVIINNDDAGYSHAQAVDHVHVLTGMRWSDICWNSRQFIRVMLQYSAPFAVSRSTPGKMFIE